MSKMFKVVPWLCWVLVCHCSGAGSSVRSADASDSAADAATATGGTAGNSARGAGGTAATGGVVNAGGNLSTAVTEPVGGTVSSGGAAGGLPATSGGILGTGGTVIGGTLAGGGSTSLGGRMGTGGSAATGGTLATGGRTYVGGASATGGNNGGNTAAGGTTPAGGNTTTGRTATAGSGGGEAGGSSAGLGAPETSPLGYGKGTTGGGTVTPVAVTDLAAMQAAIDGYSGTGGLVLKYTGKFNFATITDPCVQHTLAAQTLEIKKKSNITILGADGSSANFGIHIAASSSNIMVRNMTIGLTPGGGDSDMISLEGMSGGIPTDIWIDHNELYSSMADCPGAGDTSFDGMIDIKKGADNVTISYNYMHDHHKVSLNGYSDDDSAVRHVTFHHNLFENVGSRTPLQRHGYSHMLNNYFYKVLVSGINVRMGGYSLVEANYFETVLNPVTARDSTEIGYWDLRNNNLATQADVSSGNKFGITWDAGSAGTVNATEWTTTAAFPEPLGYDYTADPFQCVHDGLRAVVGAGKGLATLKCK